MKYKDFNRDKRNKALLAFRKKHLELSLEEIGQQFGISKQRVCQILQKNGRGV